MGDHTLFGQSVQVRGCVNGGIGSLSVHMNKAMEKAWQEIWKQNLDLNSVCSMESSGHELKELINIIREQDKEIVNLIDKNYKSLSSKSKMVEAKRLIDELNIEEEQKHLLMEVVTELVDRKTAGSDFMYLAKVVEKVPRGIVLDSLMDIAKAISTNELNHWITILSDRPFSDTREDFYK